jgi:hypothetical protein
VRGKRGLPGMRGVPVQGSTVYNIGREAFSLDATFFGLKKASDVPLECGRPRLDRPSDIANRVISEPGA